MSKIFISYRRDDLAYAAHALYDHLVPHFGVGSLVFDVKTIPFGVDFVEHLGAGVGNASIMLVVIGDNWLTISDTDGCRRLNNPKDFVRVEVQAALKRKIPVIPVLVGKAEMPRREDLPRGLKPLALCNAAQLRTGRDYSHHLESLIGSLKKHLNAVIT